MDSTEARALILTMVERAERDGTVSYFKALEVYAQRDLGGRLHAVFTIDRRMTTRDNALSYVEREQRAETPIDSP